MTRLQACVGWLLCAGSILMVPAAQASIFSGPAFFSVAPYSQMGSSSNLLAINTLNPLGYSVAGQFIVDVPAGAVSGTLLRYEVRRPLNPNFGSQSLSVLQYLIGFSQPPAGTYGNTSGYCRTYLDVGGQFANSNLNLTNGAQTWNWNVQSPFFNYTSGTDLFLVQAFELDGIKVSGPAGQWIVDLPVDSFLSPIPEPATLGLVTAGGLLVLRRSR